MDVTDTSMQANPAKLFVGNLSYNVTTEQLSSIFSQYGTVAEAIVMTDKFSGRSKGFGFVTMSSAQEAQAAVDALNEMEFEGRKLLVNVARPRQPRTDRGGFGGGNSGGYRGGSSSSHSGGYNSRDSRGSDRRGGWSN